MPSKPIPFVNQQAGAFDALSGASPSAMNVVMDARGTVRRRPGIAAYSEAPTTAVDANGIDGLYVTAGGDLYAVAGSITPERPIYKVVGGAATALGGGVSPFGVLGRERPTFAETEMLLVIAAGGTRMEKVVLSSGTSSRLAGEGQPQATHVTANSQRLLANDLGDYKGRVFFSGVATGAITYEGHEEWSYGVGTAGNFTLEARPDPVVAIAENTNEVWVWGSQTLQLFAPDPTYAFVPLSAIDTGCVAPYSMVKVDGQFAWFDDRRRFVISNGRSVDALSDPIAWQLHGLTTVDDCFGWRVTTGREDVLCWTFPTAGQTYTWQKGSGWGQWQGWSGTRWSDLGIRSHHLRRDTNVNVVGTSTGIIGKLDDETGDDLGTAIVAEVVTGFIDRETDNRKHCEGIRVIMRRDYHTTAALLRVSYRDGPGAPWEPDLSVELGTERDPVVELNSLGVYRHRQWRFRFSGSGVFTLIGVTERYEVEDN